LPRRLRLVDAREGENVRGNQRKNGTEVIRDALLPEKKGESAKWSGPFKLDMDNKKVNKIQTG